ncbi:MAG: energy-coupling factor transporter transmembrane component T family protein [Betaproteobacteria bacterium]
MSCDRRVDARLRVALAGVASVVVALTNAPAALAWLLLTAAAGAAIAVLLREARWREVLRRMLAVNGFLVLVWLTLPWAWQDGALGWSADGAALALTITARTNAIALALSALLAGLDAYAIARAAAGLGLPVKLARLLLLTVRYVGLIGETRRRLDRAMRARGFVAGANRRSLQVTAQMVALLLAHAITRAERVELALRARGFSSASAGLRQVHAGDVPRSHWAWAVGTTGALAVSWALMLLGVR